MYEFKLPDLGEGIHEAEVLKWRVQPGDTVKADQPVVDLETDKAAVTVPSPVAGKVVSVAGKPGAILIVGQVVLTIDDGSTLPLPAAVPRSQSGPVPETLPVPATPSPASPAPSLSPTTSSSAPSSGPARPTRLVPAAPATRRLARELGVNLAAVPATGPGGRVTPEDVRQFAAQGSKAQPAVAAAAPTSGQPAAEPGASEHRHAEPGPSGIPFLDLEPLPDFSTWGPVTKEPLRSIRRRVAHKMVTSMILVPHVAHMDEADVTLLEEFRQRENEARKGRGSVHLTLLPFVVKAVTAGLRAARAFNASLDPFKEEIIYKSFYNIGVAVDTGNGLVAPVVKQTDSKSIILIAAAIQELAAKAREGKLDPADLRGGTFTITNIGPLGGTALIPAINYPEVAILGMGRVQAKPVVRDGKIVIRKMLPLTLAFDHRVADGADAARFVNELVAHLSDPNKLLLET